MFARLGAAVKAVIVTLGVIAFAVFLIWYVQEFRKASGSTVADSTTYGQIFAQEGDSCWAIGERITGVGSQDNVKAFADLNNLGQGCPVQADLAYLNPWDRVVEHRRVVDSLRWRMAALVGVPIAIGFGYLLKCIGVLWPVLGWFWSGIRNPLSRTINPRGVPKQLD